MKADLRRSQILIKKKKNHQKHNKKPANGYNSQGEGGEAH
jgi:hypothetical protein